MKIIGLLAILGLALLIAGYTFLTTYDEPTYQVIESQGDIEIRNYAPYVIAEVQVSGERDSAIREGFRLLADYIFGNNLAQAKPEGGKEKIKMTAPVIQQANQKLAMTIPVIQSAKDNEWVVRFVMPPQYTLQTLPKPNNPIIMLREVPTQVMVVLRFSGSWQEKNLQQHLGQLNDYIRTHKLTVSGNPLYAFYNPPWAPPFLRRNEIMFKLENFISNKQPKKIY